MQRLFLKILPAIAVLCLLASHSSLAQTSHFRLKTADSLFQAKRYTQSLTHYEEILRQRQYTPAMLLKMAYVNEGLNEIGDAMYYLNLYFLATHDKSVLEKMDELAAKYDLQGYEITDSERFWSFYLENHLYISLALAALAILLLSIMYHTRMRLHTRPVTSGIFLFLLLLVLFVHEQYGSHRSRGIIAQGTTYLMEGPSAGASVVEIVGDGHRVDVLGKNDVWLKIRWDDDIAYVKEGALRPVRL